MTPKAQSLDLSVLEDEIRDKGTVTKEGESFEFDEEQLLTDLNEAIALIVRSKKLIDFIGDPELCKTISKRERAVIEKLSGNLSEFVDVIEGNYGEVGSLVGYDLSV